MNNEKKTWSPTRLFSRLPITKETLPFWFIVSWPILVIAALFVIVTIAVSLAFLALAIPFAPLIVLYTFLTKRNIEAKTEEETKGKRFAKFMKKMPVNGASLVFWMIFSPIIVVFAIAIFAIAATLVIAGIALSLPFAPLYVWAGYKRREKAIKMLNEADVIIIVDETTM